MTKHISLDVLFARARVKGRRRALAQFNSASAVSGPPPAGDYDTTEEHREAVAAWITETRRLAAILPPPIEADPAPYTRDQAERTGRSRARLAVDPMTGAPMGPPQMDAFESRARWAQATAAYNKEIKKLNKAAAARGRALAGYRDTIGSPSRFDTPEQFNAAVSAFEAERARILAAQTRLSRKRAVEADPRPPFERRRSRIPALELARPKFKFNAQRPRAEQQARRAGAKLVVSVTDQTKRGLTFAIHRGLNEGISPEVLSRDIVGTLRADGTRVGGMVGLNKQRVASVMNFKRDLQNMGVRPDIIDRKVAAFTDRQLRERARTIARTETIGALDRGQQAAWVQARDDDGILPEDVLKEWIATPLDSCPICARLDGEKVPLSDEFSSGHMGPTAHPRCRCTTGIAIPGGEERAEELLRGAGGGEVFETVRARQEAAAAERAAPSMLTINERLRNAAAELGFKNVAEMRAAAALDPENMASKAIRDIGGGGTQAGRLLEFLADRGAPVTPAERAELASGAAERKALRLAALARAREELGRDLTPEELSERFNETDLTASLFARGVTGNINVSLTDIDADDWYNLSNGAVTPADFLAAMTGDGDGDFNYSNVAYYIRGRGSGAVTVTINGVVLDKDGNRVGSLNRSFDFFGHRRLGVTTGGGSAKHDLFSISPNYQARGIGKSLLRSQIEMYELFGLDEVQVHANIGAGGYAWARYGFAPNDDSWDRLRQRIQTSFDDRGAGWVPPETEQRVNDLLASDDPKSIWKLADVRFQVENVQSIFNDEPSDAATIPLGRWLLAGSDWNGTLDLNDPATVSRFKTYVGGE